MATTTSVTNTGQVPAVQQHHTHTQQAEKIAFSSIPDFDFDDYKNGNADQRADFIKRYGEAFKTYGFVAIKATHLTELYKNVNREQLDYFHLPLNVKMEDFHNNFGQTGYSPPGNETAAGADKPDMKEFYHISPNHNRWPKNRPQFEATMKECHQALSEIAAQSIHYLGLFLGVTFDQEAIKNCPAHLLRLAFYPAPAYQDAEKQGMWAFPHTDLNAATLLIPTTKGLQLRTNDGRFVDVEVPDGYIIANIGEQFEMLTAGEIKAVIHQVVNPGGAAAYEERISTPFFGSLPSEWSLKPLPSCAERMTRGMTPQQSEEYLSQYPDVTVQNNLDSRLIEMNTFKNPPRHLLEELVGLGLVKKPTPQLIHDHPDLFA